MSGASFEPAVACALSVERLSVTIGARRVLRDVTLGIGRGRWVSIVGPNGAGKSTLLKAMAGLLPSTGLVRWEGRSLSSIARAERGRRLAWLGQNEAGGDDLSVYDVVMIGRMPHQRWWGVPGAQDHELVRRALGSVDGWSWRHRRLGSLSGGERQRVLLARALAVQAATILMDEPTANLDPPHQADWMSLVRAQVAAGRTVVSVLHELSLALRADDLVLVDQGTVVGHGPAASPAMQLALERLFDGRVSIDRRADGLPTVTLLDTPAAKASAASHGPVND